MADFNVGLSGPSAAGAQPVNPVHPVVKGNPYMPLVELGANMASIWMKGQAEDEKLKKEQMQQATMSQYSEKMSKIASGFESGELSVTQAKLQQQKTHRQFVAAFPQYVDDFGKLGKQFVEGTELATVKSESELQDKLRTDTLNDMNKRGYFIPPDSPRQVVDAAMEAHRQTVRTEEFAKKQKEEARFAADMAAADRSAFDFDQKRQAEQVLAASGDAHVNLLNKQVFDLGDRVRKGTLDPAAAQQQLSAMFLPVEQTITAVTSANPSAAGAYKALFSQIKEVGAKLIDPKTTAEESTNQLKILENKVKFAALSSSPESKRLYASSYLLHGNIPTIFANTGKDAIEAYAKLGESYGVAVPNVVGTKDSPAILEGLKEQVNQVNVGKADREKTLGQASNAVNNILKQTGNAAFHKLESKDIKPVVDFVGSPQFLELIKNGKVDQESLQSAKGAIQAIYEKDVQRGINQKLNTPIGGTAEKDILLKQKVEVNWNGAGLVINAGKPGEGGYLNPMEAQTRNQFVREMKPVTDVLNTVIRSGAHLEGHSNYQMYWEKNKHLIMPEVYPNPAKLSEGQVINGYKYVGGNVNDPANWIKEETTKE